jgi:hypothetical protein
MSIDDQIRRSAAAGVAHEEIAAILGVTLDEVRDALEAAPAPSADDQPDDRPLSPDQQVEAYRRLVKYPGRIEVVARDLNVSVERLSRYIVTKRAERRASAEADALARINRELRGAGCGRPIDFAGVAGRRRLI